MNFAQPSQLLMALETMQNSWFLVPIHIYVLEMDVKVVMSVADWAQHAKLEWSHRDISWWKRLEHRD
jgi:hypothetical protein